MQHRYLCTDLMDPPAVVLLLLNPPSPCYLSMQIDHIISLLSSPSAASKLLQKRGRFPFQGSQIPPSPGCVSLRPWLQLCTLATWVPYYAKLLMPCTHPHAYNFLSNLLHLILPSPLQHNSGSSLFWAKISPMGSHSNLCMCLYYHLSCLIVHGKSHTLDCELFKCINHVFSPLGSLDSPFYSAQALIKSMVAGKKMHLIAQEKKSMVD